MKEATPLSGETKEFKNERLTVLLATEPNCLVKLKITLTPEAVLHVHSQAIRKVTKNVAIPGFRKGKAPQAMIVDKYSSQIDKEWRDELVNFAGHEAFTLTQILPRNGEAVKRIHVVTLSKEKGAEVELDFESAPQVPEINGADFTIDRVIPKDVTDKIVTKALEDLCETLGDWEEVSDRDVQTGDFVDIDITTVEDESKVLGTNHRHHMNDETPHPWISSLLLGKPKGAVVEGKPGADAEEKGALPVVHKLTIKEIHIRKSRELTEELAKELGAKSLEDLRSGYREKLVKEELEIAKINMRNQLEKKLLEKVCFDLPQSIVDTERVSRIKDKLRLLQEQGISPEAISAKEQEIEEMVAQEIDRDLRLYFITEKVRHEAKFDVNQGDMLQEITKWLPDPTAITKVLQQEDERSKQLFQMAYFAVLAKKAKDYLLSQAQMV